MFQNWEVTVKARPGHELPARLVVVVRTTKRAGGRERAISKALLRLWDRYGTVGACWQIVSAKEKAGAYAPALLPDP